MSDEKKMQRAQEIFQKLCQTLVLNKWHYDRYDDELAVEADVQSEDLPINIRVAIKPQTQSVLLTSRVPLVVDEDKRLDVAVAVSSVNYMLVDGCFDFQLKTGNVYFRMTNSYIESDIGNDLFMYMILCSSRTIDDFNDKFLMLAKGMITLDQFMESIRK